MNTIPSNNFIAKVFFCIITIDWSAIYGVMAAPIVCSELLCYLQNNLSKAPRASLITAIVGFFKDDEVAAAKHDLFTVADSLVVKPENLPRN